MNQVIGGLYHFWVAVGSVVINYSPQRKFLAAHLLCAITQKLLGGVRERLNWFLKDMLFIKLHMTKAFCNAAESVYTPQLLRRIYNAARSV